MHTKGRFKVCSNCGTKFRYTGHHGTRNKNFFCTKECYLSFISKKVEVECDCCGILFLKKRSDIWRTKHNYCSHECELAYRREKGKSTWSHRVDGKVVYRDIAEKTIGRPLSTDEEVHHIDGDHFNNSPENLAILSKSEHSKIHASNKDRGEDGRFVAQKSATRLSKVLH